MCSLTITRPWTPAVSIIIPTYNEQNHIARTLSSLLNQDYPAQLTEILIVDGGSTDTTLNIIHSCLHTRSHTPCIRILNNPHRTTPHALNIGIAAARGEVIFTLGAHTTYSPNYISGTIKILHQTGADAVGSTAVTLPSAPTPIARAIARVLASPFGVGNSLMRITRPRTIRHYTLSIPDPIPADTASCPAYRRTVFEKIGTFNTALTRNQDIEFNLRLRRAGLKLLLTRKIKTYYYARATLSQLFKNSLENGYWVIKSLRYARRPFALRHLIPAAFVTATLITALTTPFLPIARILFAVISGLYITADIISSLLTAHSLRHLHLYIITYPTLHIAYGIGSLLALPAIIKPELRRGTGSGTTRGNWQPDKRIPEAGMEGKMPALS